jgi:hypothetical protein
MTDNTKQKNEAHLRNKIKSTCSYLYSEQIHVQLQDLQFPPDVIKDLLNVNAGKF